MPFRSLALAIAAAAGVKLIFPHAPLTLTEATYFILAPWYIAMILMHRDAVFGDTWKSRILVSALGGAAVGGLLYLVDAVLRTAVFGTFRLAWSPAPLDLVVLGCASAVVETVIIQLGLQVRTGGWGGVTLAALAFLLIHLSLNPIFIVAGIAFALIQKYTGLPGTVIAAHFAYNALVSSLAPN